MLNPIEKFKRSILHLNTSLHHRFDFHLDCILYNYELCRISLIKKIEAGGATDGGNNGIPPSTFSGQG